MDIWFVTQSMSSSKFPIKAIAHKKLPMANDPRMKDTEQYSLPAFPSALGGMLPFALLQQFKHVFLHQNSLPAFPSAVV